jgi:uncharacterized BrkB/YihY/UPF0761 family membrane protein
MKFIRSPIRLLALAALLFMLGATAQIIPGVLYAQTAPSAISNPIQAQNFYEFVEAIAKAITAIGIPLVAIFLVWAGFLFVTAQGSEEQLRRAKTTFFWALVGGAVIIGAWAIAIAVVNFARNLGGSSSSSPPPATTTPPPATAPPPTAPPSLPSNP